MEFTSESEGVVVEVSERKRVAKRARGQARASEVFEEEVRRTQQGQARAKEESRDAEDHLFNARVDQ